MNWLIIGGGIAIVLLCAGLFLHLIETLGDFLDRIEFRG